ncbi:MAG: glycosyl hydrolase family 28-related protein [Opitutaceae bacterium]|nr:glycosyl hydrolase family 28-related protein [Opitutaceae bacterium]
MKSLGITFGLLIATVVYSADVIPSNRRYNWQAGTNVGVPGGIWQYRSRTIVNVTGLDATGATDVRNALQAAIDAAPDDTCLLLPAGTFRLNSGINVGIKSDNSARKRITLRGAGMGQTVLKLYGSAAVSVSGGGGFPTGYPYAATLTADVAAGATTATLSEAPDFAGGFANLEGIEDNSLPVVGAIPYARPVLVYVTGHSGNTFTFEPALPFPLKAGTKFTRETGTGAPYYTIHAYRCGLEDLTVDGENSTSVITLGFFTARQCWLYNVEVKNITNYGINSAFTYQCTIRHCVVRDQFDSYPSMSSRNLVLIAESTSLLFADNLLYNGYSSMELNAGVILSAFVHNMSDRINGRDTIGADFLINHGSHNSWNLYEGNILCRLQSDGYFGSSSNETIARNWIHGTSGVYSTDWSAGGGGVAVTNNRLPLTLNRYSRQFNIVGNLIGRTVSGVTWEYSNAGRGFDTTSTSNVNPTLGSEPVFTLAPGLRYNNNGTYAILYSASNPSRWVLGSVRNYNPATGTMYLESVKRMGGTGAASDWIVKGGGGYGNNNLFSLGGPNIGNGGVWWGFGGIVAPQTLGIWWPAWDGKLKVWRGNYNSGTAYSISGNGSNGTVDAVYYVANGQYEYNNGGGILNWLAKNPAKNGLTTWDTPGPNSADWAPIGQNSNQELDYDVYGTALIKGNWNPLDNAIPSIEALGGDTVATSYVYSAKPGYLGNKSWPVFDPASPNQSFTAIPAGHRYNFFKANGTWAGSDVSGYNPDDSPGPQTNRMPSITPVQGVVQ